MNLWLIPLFLTLLPIYTSYMLVAYGFKSYHIRKNEVRHVLCVGAFETKTGSVCFGNCSLNNLSEQEMEI